MTAINENFPVLFTMLYIGESLLTFFAKLYIRLSLSDEAYNRKSLHIKRTEQFQLSLKFPVRYAGENYL